MAKINFILIILIATIQIITANESATIVDSNLQVLDSLNNTAKTDDSLELPIIQNSIEPPVKLDVELSDKKITLGDPLFIHAEVSWPQMPIPILVLPALNELPSWIDLDSMDAKQIKGIKDGQTYTKMQYRIRVYPRKSGRLNLEGITFQYRWGGELKSLSSKSHQIIVSERFSMPTWLIWTLISIVLGAIITIYIKQAKKNNYKKRHDASEKIGYWTDELHQLSAKVGTIDEKGWLERLERLCVDWLKYQVKNKFKDVRDDITIEELLEHYEIPEDKKEIWEHLNKEFYYAHYAAGAGGGRDVFQLKENIIKVRTIMNIED